MEGNKSLIEENDINVLNRCVLVTDLKLFTILENINAYFSEFGTVEKTSFIHRPDRTFTRSCIVLMKREEDVKEILKSKSHRIYDGEVRVCKYEGMDAHKKDLYDTGKFSIDISTKLLKGSCQERFEILENSLHPNYHTIEFHEPGHATITFKRHDHMKNASTILTKPREK